LILDGYLLSIGFEFLHAPVNKNFTKLTTIAFGLGEEVGPFHFNSYGKGLHMSSCPPIDGDDVYALLFL
jgi:hypothetical protein